MANELSETAIGFLNGLGGFGVEWNIFVGESLDRFSDIDWLERVDFVFGMLLGLNHLLSNNILI